MTLGMTPEMRATIRALHRNGWSPETIADNTFFTVAAVKKVLRDAGLIGVEKPREPILGYAPPPEDEDATPLARQERAESIRRAREIADRSTMTAAAARRYTAMDVYDLARRNGVSLGRAEEIRAEALRYLELEQNSERNGHA